MGGTVKHTMRGLLASIIFTAALGIAAMLVSVGARGDQVRYVRLALEDRTTLQVGQLAVLPIPIDHQYSIDGAGNALEQIRHSKHTIVYRAARTGSQTIILTPEVANGECISCATRHYFVTIVAQKPVH